MIEDLMSRPEHLEGTTYKVRWVGLAGDVNYYITVNHVEVDGRLRPFEVFINSQDVTHAPWMVAMARTISAVFRRGGDVDFLAEELQEVYDPVGPQVTGGRKVKSLIALIGEILERHMITIGYLPSPEEPA